jgi:hypothetical protein
MVSVLASQAGNARIGRTLLLLGLHASVPLVRVERVSERAGDQINVTISAVAEECITTEEEPHPPAGTSESEQCRHVVGCGEHPALDRDSLTLRALVDEVLRAVHELHPSGSHTRPARANRGTPSQRPL